MEKPIIELKDEDVKKAKEFSQNVVKETYNRFSQNLETRKERIFFGKLGEIAFLNYLNSKNIEVDITGMFEIYEGITNVDMFDFVTIHDETIDIKAAYKNFHKRILIPYDQYEMGRAKDYYVGVAVDLESKRATMCGFISKEKLLINGKINFGEGYAYWEYLNNLEPIEKLLKLMQ
jgi:hypothetical protein